MSPSCEENIGCIFFLMPVAPFPRYLLQSAGRNVLESGEKSRGFGPRKIKLINDYAIKKLLGPNQKTRVLLSGARG